MSEMSAVESSLGVAWDDMMRHQNVAPSLEKSAQEVSHLLGPLLEFLEENVPDADVKQVFPGVVAVGGPDSALGNGASVKMKSLEPLTGGLFVALRDGSYILMTEVGGLWTRGQYVRGVNLFTAKVLFMKVPSIEIVQNEDGDLGVLRFVFDDLPRSVVEKEVMPHD